MKKMLIGAVAAAVAASTLLATAPAHASTATIRPGDLIPALSGTRSAGHVEFLRDGVHLYTDNNTSQAKAAEYFAISPVFPASASLTWVGTQPQPGQQIVFDVDQTTGNGNDYNILVGEPVYNGNWWLTNGSSADAKAADPSGTNDGGNGSAYFGTLAQWKAALPDARVLAGGFSLGSGVLGDGVIERMQYGTTVYEFTNLPVVQDGTDGTDGQDGQDGQDGADGTDGTNGTDGADGQDGTDGAQGPQGPAGPTGPQGPAGLNGTDGTNGQTVTATVAPAAQSVKGYASFVKSPRKVKVVLVTAPQPTGTPATGEVVWTIQKDGVDVREVTQSTHGAKTNVAVTFKAKSGKHTVIVLRDGKQVRKVSIRTGR